MSPLSALLLVALAVTCAVLETLRRRLLRTNEEMLSDLDQAERRIEVLRRYEAIEDAEAEARRITDAAVRSSDALRLEAEGIQSAAHEAAATARREAREASDVMLASARTESSRIVEDAHAEAVRIAGDAIEAKDKAGEYRRIARAMRNTISGYGDEYLVPNHTLIDDLAEEFGHKEAGAELAEARRRTRAMVKEGTAADCDYKEPNRRATAIHFVLDAFNGKVESALSKVRHDNYGKLAQRMKDAFRLVNMNGEAFKNARIEPAYLDARLQELRWAVATNELKIQEREEQRLIKEAMREEERARREYERARKEAEKEEKAVQGALREARAKLLQASQEERARLEEQLQELQERLAEAEAKNERALSMAQQTRRGHVYVISNVGSFGHDVLKIGLTRRLEPLDRVKELGDASVPFEFDVHALIHHEDAPELEAELHRRFDDYRVNKVNRRKEFFSVPIREVRALAEDLGIDVHWTMTAEAREYRESLAEVGAVVVDDTRSDDFDPTAM